MKRPEHEVAVGQVWREKYVYRQIVSGNKPPRRILQIAEVKGSRVTKIVPITTERLFGAFGGIEFLTLIEKWELLTNPKEMLRPPLKPGEIDVLLSVPGPCELVLNGVYLPRWMSDRIKGKLVQITAFDDEKVWKQDLIRERYNKPSSVSDFRERWILVARTYEEWCELRDRNQLVPPFCQGASSPPALSDRSHASLANKIAMLEAQRERDDEQRKRQDERIEWLMAQLEKQRAESARPAPAQPPAAKPRLARAK